MRFKILFVVAMLFVFNACSTEPENSKAQATLTAIDAAVTETYVNVNISNCIGNETINVKRNGNIIAAFTAFNGDTVITDTALTRLTNYNYSAEIISTEKSYSSNTITITTLEPDDRPITWEVYEFGDYGESSFRDVTITETGEIWAAGEVHYNENGNLSDAYGAAHWDGNKWKLWKVYASSFGNPTLNPMVTKTIFANSNNLFATTSAAVLEYKDTNFVENAFVIKNIDDFHNTYGQIEAMWVNENNEIYCVGRKGAVYYINGTNWQRLETGSGNDFFDIWGYIDPVDQKEKKLFVTSNFNINEDVKIYKISESIGYYQIPLDIKIYNFYTVWTNNGFPVFTGGSYLVDNRKGKFKITKSSYAIKAIRGTGLNDIFYTGINSLLIHSNGIEEKQINLGIGTVYLENVCVTKNLIAIAGRKDAKAVIIIGRR